MAWRIVKQPNGLLARFSDVVDNFTVMNMTEETAYKLCCEEMSEKEAKAKVMAGLEDHKPRKVGVKGNGLDRWEDSLRIIRNVYGRKIEQTVRERGSDGQI